MNTPPLCHGHHGGVEDLSIPIDLAAHQGVAAGIAIDDQIDGHRLVPMGRLDGSIGHHSKHGPERVADRPGGGELVVAEQDAEAIGTAGNGIIQQPLKLRFQQLAGVMAG